MGEFIEKLPKESLKELLEQLVEKNSRGTVGTISKEVPNPNPEKYPAAIPKGTFGRSFEEVSEEGIPEKKTSRKVSKAFPNGNPQEIS